MIVLCLMIVWQQKILMVGFEPGTAGWKAGI